MTEQLEFGLSVSCTTWPQLICPSAADDAHAPNLPNSCYTVVQPGLQSGSTYIEFQVQSMRYSSRGIGGLKFWVVSLGCLLARHCAGPPLCTCCLTLGVLESTWCASLGLADWEQPYLGAEVFCLQHCRTISWSGLFVLQLEDHNGSRVC